MQTLAWRGIEVASMSQHLPNPEPAVPASSGAPIATGQAKADSDLAGHSAAPSHCRPPRIPDHQLVRRIGAGSYGEVWLARNVLGGYRAVKIVYRNSFDSDRPFEREFHGIQKFEPISRSHQSQVPILHVGREDDCFYYVMELADDAATGSAPSPQAQIGLDPAAYVPKTLKTLKQGQDRLSFRDSLEIGLALTTALGHLHKNGLVHRDVKPSNVIYVNGVPKLADIGLVTDVEATVSFVGTEGFIPPEGPGTPQADLYALGKVLYEISTGKDRLDFPEPPTLVGEFPDREQVLELGEIIKRACARNPSDRYKTSDEMQADLLLLKTGKSVRRLHGIERRVIRLTRAGIAAAVLLGVAGPGFLVALYQKHQAVESSMRADADARR